MTLPPALAAIMIPAGLFAAWLFLHKDADVEQRIDKRDAIHEQESANFDRDFSRLTGDVRGEAEANDRKNAAEIKIVEVDKARKERAKNDQRAAVMQGVDDFLASKEKENK